jgi:hypothetical protein
MPRHPAYAIGMDAKTRYRRRLKVQAALCRVLSLLLPELHSRRD